LIQLLLSEDTKKVAMEEKVGCRGWRGMLGFSCRSFKSFKSFKAFKVLRFRIGIAAVK
jgi:hypothetical protein